MEPLFFGPTAAPLFGVYHAAAGRPRDTALLLCPSWGLEASRSVRGLRTLADLLAQAGFETLRFDYAGTGDSAGDALELRLENWLESLRVAATELRDMSGRPRLALMGLRLGALLASAALQRGVVKADALIAVDAPANGAQFMAEIRTIAKRMDAHKNRFREKSQPLPPHEADELLGFSMPAALAAALGNLPAVQAAPLLWAHTGPATAALAGAEVAALGEAAHWDRFASQFAPWNPVGTLQTLAQRTATWLR